MEDDATVAVREVVVTVERTERDRSKGISVDGRRTAREWAVHRFGIEWTDATATPIRQTETATTYRVAPRSPR